MDILPHCDEFMQYLLENLAVSVVFRFLELLESRLNSFQKSNSSRRIFPLFTRPPATQATKSQV